MFVPFLYELRARGVPVGTQEARTLASADLTLIVTDHDWYDWSFVGAHARLIVDTRNAMAHAPGAAAKVVKA